MGEERVAGFPYILTGLCCEGAVLKFSMDKCLLAIWGDWLLATAWVHGLGQWTWWDLCLVLRLPPAPSPPLFPITGALRNAPVPSKAHMIWEPRALSSIFQILAQRVEVREVTYKSYLLLYPLSLLFPTIPRVGKDRLSSSSCHILSARVGV